MLLLFVLQQYLGARKVHHPIVLEESLFVSPGTGQNLTVGETEGKNGQPTKDPRSFYKRCSDSNSLARCWNRLGVRAVFDVTSTRRMVFCSNCKDTF